MALQKLQFRPGVNRESTTLANEGGFFDCEKIRFRSGSAEKLGGWDTDAGSTDSTLKPPVNLAPLKPPSYWGTARSMWNWITLSGYNLLALGTNLKYYIQNGTGGTFYDITPLRQTTSAGDVSFSASSGSRSLLVTDAAHGAQAGDFVTFSGALSLGGSITSTVLNAEFQVVSVPSNSQYIVAAGVSATAADSGNGGSSTVGRYQVVSGGEAYSQSVGWGAGGWSGVNTGATPTGWGSPSTAGLDIGVQLRLWSQRNFGENLVLCLRGGSLFFWAENVAPNIYNRAQLLGPNSSIVVKNTTGAGTTTVVTDSACPSVANFVTVSDASRFVLAFGCNDYGSTLLTPMLIRWSDQESFATWLPSATNQAGSYTLSSGSSIISAIQTRQEILVYTDAAVYSMQYLGAPFVWGFQLLGDNISIMGPNAVITANNITYWMGIDKFYMYSGRVETLPCTVRQYVFDDINTSQQYQFFAGTNEAYNEVWWYYCSITGDSGLGTKANPNVKIDRYVIYNHLERTWYYGTLNRTAWLDSALRTEPMAAGYNGQLIYHESGVDDGTTSPPSPIVSFVQSSDFDIGDGHNFGFAWRIIPDISFDGSSVAAPEATFTIRPRQNPGAKYGVDNIPRVISTQNYQQKGSYKVQSFTQIVFIRARGRQLALAVGSSALGVQWQLGVPRLDVRPDGQR